ncbi:MAG: SpoIIE family protein phosphatase [Chloroflexi bacterium]|nr:SpoIIE family protein phosphatase [Chloroflexota bacterium]
METEQIVSILGKVPLFQPLPEEELRRLARILEMITPQPGSLLFREDDYGDFFYVLIDGEVEILKALGTPAERLIAVRGPGEFIGEMSLLNLDGLRTASVRTRGKARLLEISRLEFNSLLERQPTLAYRMVRVLSERLKANENEAIRELTAKNVQLQQAYENLQAAQAELVEKEKLERELQLARQIQVSVLPNELPTVPGYDLGALMHPARAVGGDFFDFIPLSGGRLGIVVGDVTDKGMPAAIFMAQTYALLHAEASRGAAPQLALRRANQLLLKMNARGLFATILYGILHPTNRTFTYARAGHDLPLLYQPDSGAALLPRGAGQPLGILDNPQLDRQTIHIPPGGALLLYTDGATDERSPQDEIFGAARLKQIFTATAAISAQAGCQHIYQALLDFKADGPGFDDITLVLIK